MDIKYLFGLNLQRLRKSKGISQEKLAELCNLHRTYIGSVERGERNIGIVNIALIAQALKVPISKLFEDVKDK